MVGQWPSGARQLGTLPEQVLDLIEDKVDDLKERRVRVENRLFRLGLTDPKTCEKVKVGPMAGPGGWIDWLAVSLFRQWVADNTSPSGPPNQQPPSSRSAPNPSTNPTMSPGLFYRLLSSPPYSSSSSSSSSSPPTTTYLTHDDLKKFLRSTPGLEHNRETLKKLEKRVEEMKAQAREVVRAAGLGRSCLELDVGANGGIGGSGGLGYLVCTRVEEGEWPWEEG